ncbi:hypothetical protein GIB67_004037 [Kingdonia uniflora]|uniref:KIB1-4 beta-propeller domain-containing protein n=1 Tax=Kingdonia uniflora TaxID=39325 RepID=A0A7J7NR22_9MAGN|nr:hypothetical protein GIB67_004037 [Kingdonia uniflora]
MGESYWSSTLRRCKKLKRDVVVDDDKQRDIVLLPCPAKGMTRNWSQLPQELIGEIAKRIIYINDFYTFGSVCQSWRYITKHKYYYSGVRELPWLMLSETSEDNNVRSFFSLSTNKVFSFQLPEAKGRQCFGSPLGWVTTLGLDHKIHLLNPLTRIQIQLPSLDTFQDPLLQCGRGDFYLCQLFIKKFIFASTQNNNSGGLIVFAIYSNTRKLAMARPGDEAWTTLGDHHGISDAIYYEGQIYAITTAAILRIYDISSSKVTDFMPPPQRINLFQRSLYLVEIGEFLHLVTRQLVYSTNPSVVRHPYATLSFEVYLCNPHAKRWVRLYSSYGFDKFSLFVGANSSFALSVSDYPELKGNCIYFTDDTFLHYQYGCGRHNMGVFDFKEWTIQPFYSGPGTVSQFSPPVWFMPNPW